MKIGLLFLVTLHCVNAQQNQWKVSVTNPTITSITELPNGNRRVCGTFALTNTGADLRCTCTYWYQKTNNYTIWFKIPYSPPPLPLCLQSLEEVTLWSNVTDGCMPACMRFCWSIRTPTNCCHPFFEILDPPLPKQMGRQATSPRTGNCAMTEYPWWHSKAPRVMAGP